MQPLHAGLSQRDLPTIGKHSDILVLIPPTVASLESFTMDSTGF